MSSSKRRTHNSHYLGSSNNETNGSKNGSNCCCGLSFIGIVLTISLFLAIVLAVLIVYIIFFQNRDDDDEDTHLQVIIPRSPEEQRLCNLTKAAPRDFVYPLLDAPRTKDEHHFCHLPVSRGGVLRQPVPKLAWTTQLRRTAQAAYEMFALFDEKEKRQQQENSNSHNTSGGSSSNSILEVYGTMCVGIDCDFIADMIVNLKAGVGHFIVVVNTDQPQFVFFFTTMQELFPGRFSTFIRPQKLSCAESWNLVIRMGFSIRPMPDQVFISNADWHVKQIPNVVPNAFEDYLRFTRRNSHHVINRYFHFSSFSYMRKGYLALGYADETLLPALSEDVELHLRSVAGGMGQLGLYPYWQAASNHRNRASAGERDIMSRNNRCARWNYILQKWGVNVPAFRDFALAKPYKTPFNLPIAINNSWSVDAAHRRCVMATSSSGAGSGIKFKNNPRRCWWNPAVLKSILLDQKTAVLPQHLFSMMDSFPNGG